ncbi:sulfite exporter TauE/SafE family protein [Candidatus Woesebacteria bacterium]|nr:MAG: sulfite exporter TauE/SafE family protein [Candidatus Woesebacteria bacterium]
MVEITYPIALMAGVVSFLSPCAVGLLPTYIGYVTGIAIEDLKKKGYKPYRKKMILASLLYTLGFSTVFVLLGTTAAGLGVIFRQYSLPIQQIGGLIIIFFGLEFSGLIRLPFLSKTYKFSLPTWVEKTHYVKSFLVGVIFATAWSPCVGVVLGSILALAATTHQALSGAMLLFVYSLGISIPFLIVTFTLISAPKYLKIFTKYTHIISIIAGSILVIVGLMLVTNTYRYLNTYVSNLLN